MSTSLLASAHDVYATTYCNRSKRTGTPAHRPHPSIRAHSPLFVAEDLIRRSVVRATQASPGELTPADGDVALQPHPSNCGAAQPLRPIPSPGPHWTLRSETLGRFSSISTRDETAVKS